jgi:hypothetical protein
MEQPETPSRTTDYHSKSPVAYILGSSAFPVTVWYEDMAYIKILGGYMCTYACAYRRLYIYGPCGLDRETQSTI